MSVYGCSGFPDVSKILVLSQFSLCSFFQSYKILRDAASQLGKNHHLEFSHDQLS